MGRAVKEVPPHSDCLVHVLHWQSLGTEAIAVTSVKP